MKGRWAAPTLRESIMPRLALTLLATWLLMTAWLAPARGADEPTPETERALRFVRGLRERGYFDLATEYLEQLQTAKDTPADLREILDFELGLCLLDEASRDADLERRKERFDEARAKFDAFAKAHPNHPRAPEALAQVGRQFFESGHLAVLMANDAKDSGVRQAKLTEARALFDRARAAYDQAIKPLQAAFDAFPKYIPEKDPRRAGREQAHIALMNAQLQRYVVDYEEAQTYAPGSKERNALLDKSIAAFEEVFKRYRDWMAGLYARMWQGKCYEEKGELGAAMGIYNELMSHSDPHLKSLQRTVGYFRIIVLGKRKEFALATDEAVRWIQANPDARRTDTEEWLGVHLELAKNIIAQLEAPGAPSKGSEREAALRRVVEALSEAVRYSSPHKAEALALLQKYKPKAAEKAMIPASLTYDDAMGQADTAISSEEWDRAIALLKAAVHRADPAKEPEKANRARYMLAFCYYQTKHYYEAAVLAEHLARRYPQGGLSAKATQIALAALTDAYNTYRRERTSDLNHLIDLAQYTAETFPNSDEGDAARLVLGDIHLEMGKYEEAAKAFEAVRPKSPRIADAQNRAGQAHWKLSQFHRSRDQSEQADAEAKTALNLLRTAYETRQKTSASPTDPGLLGNACDLAEVELAENQAKAALDLLEPLAKAPGLTNPAPNLVPLVSRLLAVLLRTHIAVGQVNGALADMARLEKLGGSEGKLTQLYYELGRLLEREMEALKRRGDINGFERTQQAYRKFLEVLVASKAGQSYESLQWAGEALLSMSESARAQAEESKRRRMVKQAEAILNSAHDMARQAEGVFRRVLATYANDAAFQQSPQGKTKLLRTRLKLAAALRNAERFPEAKQVLDDVSAQHKTLLDLMMEQGFLLEARAQAGDAKWSDALDYWRQLSLRLRSRGTPRVEYYEACYHIAWALYKDGKPDEAKRALKGVMRLYPHVGGPEMKAKYEELLKRLGA
jgi:tetratricopeptide (TPR) repeat protein